MVRVRKRVRLEDSENGGTPVHHQPRSSTANVNDFEEDLHEDEGTLIIDDIYMPPPPVQPKNLDDQTGKRLIIETIDIINFKSYGGHKVLGPFYKSFNSIVGPNGSGKSNVIDSMLFVFGYRAQKLRSKKISNIIHHSDMMPECDHSQVNVNFVMIDDKGDNKMNIIEDSRFTISRIVYKNNSSDYMINGRRVQFKDVSKKLNDFGIDLRYNRFLILQGEVEQISLMKPKGDANNDIGMLEYLEDIVGTSRYKVPIEKLTQKFNDLNAERTQFANRVNRCKVELSTVEKAKNEAVEVLKLENEKMIEQSKIKQWQLYKLKKKIEKPEAEFKDVQDRFNELANQEKEVEKHKQKCDEEEKEKSAEYERIRKESDETKEKYQDCESKDYYLCSKRKSANEKLKKLKKKIVENKKILEDLQNAPSQSDEQEAKLEKEKVQIQQKLQDLEQEIIKETEIAQKECADTIKKKEECNVKLMKFKDDQSDKLTAQNEAYNKFTILKQKSASAREKRDQLEAKVKKINEETAEKMKMIDRYKEEIPNEKAKLQDLHKQYEKKEQSRAALTEKMNGKNAELQQLKHSANQVQSRDQIRNALMNEMRNGTLQGILGRLGDLGAIDKKYDIAVSTACGRLKNFVVDTIENAQKCVEFLKQNNLPPVTFIALDKLRVTPKEKSSYPENVPRLFDLIRIEDERVRIAFYYALGETLVANDIDQAKRITQRNRYRIVTLNGDLIEFEGAMTGGGRPRSGGMGQSITESTGVEKSQEQIDELEKEVDSMREKRQQIDYDIDRIREEIEKVEKDIHFMEEKLNNFQLEVKDSGTRLSQLVENLEQLKLEVEREKDNPELDSAEQDYLEAKKIYEKEMSKVASIQEEIEKLDEEIKMIVNKRLGSLKKKRKSLEKNISDIQAELDTILADRKTAELKLKKAEETVAADEKNIEETEKELKDIEQQVAEIEELGREYNAKYLQALERCQSLEKEFNDIKNSVREANKKLKEIKDQRLELEHDVETRLNWLKEKREKVSRLQQELNQIRLHNLDDLDEKEQVAESAGDSNEDQQNDSVTKLPQLTPDELEDIQPEIIERKIKAIDAKLENHKSINFAAIEEYQKKRRDYREKQNDLENITQKRDIYLEHLNNTIELRQKEFRIGFNIIARKLKELYRTITLGGDADLEYIDSLNPFTEGINFAVRPNKKPWKNNINLSGGEKTLASLALIFALHYYKPSPLYIMDEIDAALDFKNVSIIANYIKDRTKNSQFLIISLRNNMYELADRLIGIYKTFNITKSIPFDPAALEEKCRSNANTIDQSTNIPTQTIEQQTVSAFQSTMDTVND